MSSVSLRHIYKKYPGGVTAVSDFNLEIEDKEFIILVGPSGCGKSTTLRMIAGLEEITQGELYIDDKLCNNVQPKDRDIAMVFQNYALYPHMTVFENMSFGLSLKRLPKSEIRRRVEEASRILEIEHLLDRKPAALSGGQRQRVALGRAIVRNPKVFLLDEPLSNLDAKLRAQMRAELSKLHLRLNTTFIYVTHDQTEAMTMGTRIVVLKDGLIQQISTPQELYENPVNLFVATFIGTPQMNTASARLERRDDRTRVIFGTANIPLPDSIGNSDELKPYIGQEVIFGIRPENICEDDARLAANPDAVVEVRVDVTEMMGAETNLYLLCGEHHLTAKVGPNSKARGGEALRVAFDTEKIMLFDPATERRIIQSARAGKARPA